MKEIKLTQGQVALVDDEDFDELSRYKWYAIKSVSGNTYYAGKKDIVRKTVLMHHQIQNLTTMTDHIDGNGCNNQKTNLRQCTCQQNQMNQIIQRRSTSGFKGVSKNGSSWAAYINYNGSHIYLGSYKLRTNAALAYNQKAAELFGEFARLNNVMEE
jgi:hypothetical protein